MKTSDDDRPIRRCVCADVAFEALWASGVRSLAEAEDRGCGVTCGRCRPYLARMARTGETAFATDQALG